MTEMGQSEVEPDGKNIIEQVLFKEGVLQDDTIFTSTISAHKDQPVLIYNSPSKLLAHTTKDPW